MPHVHRQEYFIGISMKLMIITHVCAVMKTTSMFSCYYGAIMNYNNSTCTMENLGSLRGWSELLLLLDLSLKIVLGANTLIWLSRNMIHLQVLPLILSNTPCTFSPVLFRNSMIYLKFPLCVAEGPTLP